jgi:hypothetical protein
MRLDQKFMIPSLPWEESAREAASMAARLGRIELGVGRRVQCAAPPGRALLRCDVKCESRPLRMGSTESPQVQQRPRSPSSAVVGLEL